MSDKKKINEMASDMDYGCIKHDLWPDDAKEIAKALIILGYQKVKEDEMVISKQDYEELKKDCADIAGHYQEMGRFYDEKCEECDRISKETAEKVINKVRRMLWSCNTVRIHNKHTITPCVGYLMSDVDDGLDELEKEFGIGIKE